MSFKIGDIVVYKPTRLNPIARWKIRIGKKGKIIQLHGDSAVVLFDTELKNCTPSLRNLQLFQKRGHHLTKIFQ